MTNSLALNFTLLSCCPEKVDQSWRPSFSNWVRRPVKRTCAKTPCMLAAFVIGATAILGCENGKCRSQYPSRTAGERIATNPARRSGPDTNSATIICDNCSGEGSNDENQFPWAWRWFRSKFRASVSARRRGLTLEVLRVSSKAPGFVPGSRERDDLSPSLSPLGETP